MNNIFVRFLNFYFTNIKKVHCYSSGSKMKVAVINLQTPRTLSWQRGRAHKVLNKTKILTVVYATQVVAKRKPEKNSGLNGI